MSDSTSGEEPRKWNVCKDLKPLIGPTVQCTQNCYSSLCKFYICTTSPTTVVKFS